MDYQLANLLFTLFAWTVLTIFFVATVFWLIEIVIIGRARRGAIEHEPAEVEVRVMTVAAERVVQATVDQLPTELDTIRVIAERPITIDGAEVCVVPSEFECEATRKGRALEWARRELNCNASYILYLDEDTLLREFHGLPDADIVQLSEQPIRSDSWLTYFAEIFRMGFQLEQAVFPKFRYPLYAWGGGIAVRKELEDQITWDVNTVTEDTNFVWRAFQAGECAFQFLNIRAMNQAPPSVREMIYQRRRWISGAARDSHLLPRRYQLLSLMRNAAWGLVFVSPLLALPLVTPVTVVLFPVVYGYGILFQLVGLFGWAVLGYWYYGERPLVLAALLVTIPLVAIIHAAGAFWAIFQPTTEFRVTQKVPPAEVEDSRAAEIAVTEKHTDSEQTTEETEPVEPRQP
ncbi:glycosyltransferase [Halorubrum rutilum]|uniref:Glycosyltransferase n=1 Tax=Halorubrum rutilum TaxID=1364933 RepID=A0ABD6AML3_9EURY|nr:glycosyltransferase family 2 protein [Halorubrum rutilum]